MWKKVGNLVFLFVLNSNICPEIKKNMIFKIKFNIHRKENQAFSIIDTN